MGGAPYTPYDVENSSLVEAWDASGSLYYDYSRFNSERLKPFTQLEDVYKRQVQRDEVYPLYFADFLFYQGLERNTAIAVVCDKGKMFGARIQFPDQFYIGFDIIAVSYTHLFPGQYEP